MQSYQGKRDRCSKRLKTRQLIVLVLSVLAIVFCGNFSNAQVSNDLAFEDLVLQHFAKSGFKIDSITGFTTKNVLHQIHLDSSVNRTLNIDVPTILFEPAGKRKFIRSIETVLNFRDTMEVGIVAVIRDTVNSKMLGVIRKSTYPELRGESPRVISKYIGPVLLIGTGIAGIFLLFYMRS